MCAACHRMWVKTLLLLCVWVSFSVCGIVGPQKTTDVPTVLHGGIASQSFTKSVSDAILVYEFLLGGLVINSDNNISLMDEEFTSMRQGRAFTAYLNDHVPKTLVAMEKLLALTSTPEKTLHPLRFEIFILGAVYSAYQMKRQTSEQDQQAWGGVLARLASAALSDLRSNAISN